MKMKTNTVVASQSIPKNLHQLVDQVAGGSIPKAVKRNSFIINEVPRGFQVASNEKLLTAILNKMLSTVVSHSNHSCIRIKANVYGDILCFSIKDKSSFSDHAVTADLEPVKQMVKKLKGNVIIRNMEDKFTTILLSLPNIPLTA
jgi:hypothetical protein